ncbi:hypothetical protein MACH17_16060 [Phaeobacter inhibens]|uniref:hypothetical protein n=1 Tax=Phaeobacter inhibens TaxID=221822 RepID=UPI002767E097|nr:hypothetical protein [Phaeobacter inhibens]GLO70089.1 hypothetical protein MACH17_16060 [Phaeobacter inhibens]
MSLITLKSGPAQGQRMQDFVALSKGLIEPEDLRNGGGLTPQGAAKLITMLFADTFLSKVTTIRMSKLTRDVDVMDIMRRQLVRVAQGREPADDDLTSASEHGCKLTALDAQLFASLTLDSRATKDKATAYKSVKAIWHDKKVGEKKTVTEGEGSPSYEMTHPYRTEEAAQRAAKSKLDEQARAEHSLSPTLVGNLILRAEGQALIVGLRPSIPPLWSITGVTHRLGSGGYTTQIRGELPKNEG